MLSFSLLFMVQILREASVRKQSSIFPKMLNHSLRSLIKGEICKDWPTVEFKFKTKRGQHITRVAKLAGKLTVRTGSSGNREDVVFTPLTQEGWIRASWLAWTFVLLKLLLLLILLILCFVFFQCFQ